MSYCFKRGSHPHHDERKAAAGTAGRGHGRTARHVSSPRLVIRGESPSRDHALQVRDGA